MLAAALRGGMEAAYVTWMSEYKTKSSSIGSNLYVVSSSCKSRHNHLVISCTKRSNNRVYSTVRTDWERPKPGCAWTASVANWRRFSQTRYYA